MGLLVTEGWLIFIEPQLFPMVAAYRLCLLWSDTHTHPINKLCIEKKMRKGVTLGGLLLG